jgi:hypothetical protein
MPTMIHRFVKTTPKPRATKKSSGRPELVSSVDWLEPLVEAAGGAEAEVELGTSTEVADGTNEVIMDVTEATVDEAMAGEPWCRISDDTEC